jgi:hemoglobin-like flavoprotein
VFLPIVEHLGRKHRQYGVKNSDYLTFGLALFSMLQEILGAGFASENAVAWMNLYAVLADTMRGARLAEAVSAGAPRRPRRPP